MGSLQQQQSGGQRSVMSIQQQQPQHPASSMLSSSLESSDGGGSYSVHADFMNPLDVQMASIPEWLGESTPSGDPELSDIIEQVIDMNERYESEPMIFCELPSATSPPLCRRSSQNKTMSVQQQQSSSSQAIASSVTQATASIGPTGAGGGPLVQQMDISNEKMAITAIQKSLMSFEKISPVAPSPPAYNLPGYGQQQQQQGPPTMRMSTTQANYGGMNSPSTQVVGPPGSMNMAMPGARKQKLPVQQRRLLNRQQQQAPQQEQQQQQQQPPQQQLLGVLLNEAPVQHTQGAQLSPGALQIMDDLLNDIPPNMTISR